MAECKECLHYDICEIMHSQYGISKIYPSQCGFYKNTADVVPKSKCDECAEKTRNTIVKLQGQIKHLKKYDEERDIALHARLIAQAKTEVAREIFEEIEKLSYYAPTPYDDEINVVDYEDIAELKKKYTEEKT